MRKFTLIFGLVFIVASSYAEKENSISFLPECLILKNTTSDFTAQEALSQAFELNPSGTPNLGVSDKRGFVRFKAKNDESNSVTTCFINNTTIDLIRIYRIAENDLILIGEDGASKPYNTRISKTTAFSFDLNLAEGEEAEFLIEAQSGKQLIIPIQLGKHEAILLQSGYNDSLMFLYFGIIAVLIFYNLFLSLATREKGYLIYVGYLVAVGMTQVTLFGYGNRLFWPNSEWWSLNGVHFWGAMSGIATIIFVKEFIRTKLYTPWIDRILWLYVGLDIFSIGLLFAGRLTDSYNVINFCAASSLILLIAAFMAAKKGNRSAKYFIFAWSIFIATVTVFALKDFGILPYNTWTIYALPFGSAAEGVLLSFALADKINVLKREKQQSDAERIAMIETQNVILEKKVHERTSELEEAKDQIQSQYDHLRLTQKQLVESEKLAGLGQMTAGIAHELNNPINFVSSNVGPLHRDIEDIMSMLTDFYNMPEDVTQDQILAIKEKCKKLGIDFIGQEIHQLLHGIEEGSRRTAEIVKGLRIFARADKDTLVPGNLNECLQSTLVVMKSITKGQVTVHKDIDDKMPTIECFPGKLNQVIANLIANAVQATKMPGRSTLDRQVFVKSWHDEKYVHVSVKDNGCGIEDAAKEKIFVPFYTTKSVGEGTGLGLSIAMGIVEEHNGEIEVISTPGEGSEFIVHLPRARKGVSLSAA